MTEIRQFFVVVVIEAAILQWSDDNSDQIKLGESVSRINAKS